MERAIAGLDASDFSLEKHRRIFGHLKNLFEQKLPLDLLARELMATGQLESVGGLSYLAELTDNLPPLVNIGTYIAIVKEQAVLRRTLGLAQMVMNQCYEHGAKPDEILASYTEKIKSLRGEIGSSTAAIDRLPAVGAVDEEEASYIVAPELPVGSVVAFTGESGCGKSTLCTMYAREAIARGRPVLVLDRENPRSVIRERLQRLGIEESDILRWWGGWNEEEPPSPGSAIVRNWVKCCERGPLVVIDNAAAFQGGDENDAMEMRAFMNQARILASLGACVIVLHNSGKAETSREYRGSSDFKASVDQAFKVENISSDSNLGQIRLRCFKSRYGFAGSVIYHYAEGRFTRDDRPKAEQASNADRMTAILRQNPGCTGAKFESLAASLGMPRQLARAYLENGVLGELILREKGTRNQFRYFLVSI
jgi:energy-coupling factor transporter ATP-binding protein EcfA2